MLLTLAEMLFPICLLPEELVNFILAEVQKKKKKLGMLIKPLEALGVKV